MAIILKNIGWRGQSLCLLFALQDFCKISLSSKSVPVRPLSLLFNILQWLNGFLANIENVGQYQHFYMNIAFKFGRILKMFTGLNSAVIHCMLLFGFIGLIF